MQRSITYKTTVSDLLWVVVFAIYIALSSIYLFLPPMLALLGYLYFRALYRNDLFSLIIASIMLLMLEAEKGYWFGSTLVLNKRCSVQCVLKEFLSFLPILDFPSI